MLGNSIWYIGNYESTKSGFQSGFVNISLEEIMIGLMINLLSFPIVFFISFLFKYSKPRCLRENRVIKALSTDGEENQFDKSATLNSSKSENNIMLESKLNPPKFSLPFFCAYIGWFLTFFCIAVSIFFLWAYGITFGNDILYKWLTSFVISFFTSFLIFEPMKVCETLYISI